MEKASRRKGHVRDMRRDEAGFVKERPVAEKGHFGGKATWATRRTALLPIAEEPNSKFTRVVFREIIDCERGCKSPISAAE